MAEKVLHAPWTQMHFLYAPLPTPDPTAIVQCPPTAFDIAAAAIMRRDHDGLEVALSSAEVRLLYTLNHSNFTFNDLMLYSTFGVHLPLRASLLAWAVYMRQRP
jgi:hypothetical protein